MEGTGDSPPTTDDDSDSLPDWVETTSAVFENVWAKEITAYGYRPPKSDLSSADHGPDGRLDVYLAELRSEGLFGFCDIDDPNLEDPSYPYFDMSAFCSVDNDFVGYPKPPLLSLQVTAAHEFFHASQFAYDYFEDPWLMEGTAAWIEDEAYDAVNDNYDYIEVSPLELPFVPLDTGLGGHEYGAWVFWRYLSETFGSSFIRDVWNRADGSASGPDNYSLQALIGVLGTRGSNLRTEFADFAALTYFPAHFYEEGRSYGPGVIPTFVRLSNTRTSVSMRRILDHLTNNYIALIRSSAIAGDAKLQVDLNLPPLSRGSNATLIILPRSGNLRFVHFRGNAQGDKALRVPFGSDIQQIIVVLTNASGRFGSCFSLVTVFSCNGGIPLDDNQPYRFTARVIQ
ncbi:MAG: MXAN_6640 family putative metalloprotease [Actinomycetota bacterium]